MWASLGFRAFPVIPGLWVSELFQLVLGFFFESFFSLLDVVGCFLHDLSVVLLDFG